MSKATVHRGSTKYFMLICELETIKPLNPAQARVRALQARVKSDQAAVKIAKANEKIQSGQKAIQKARMVKPAQ